MIILRPHMARVSQERKGGDQILAGLNGMHAHDMSYPQRISGKIKRC